MATIKSLSQVVANDPWHQTLTRVPDPDIVLAKAGKHRADLKIIKTDGHLRDVRKKATLAMRSKAWQIEPNESPFAKWLMDERLDGWVNTILAQTLNAEEFGYSVSEIIYTEDETGPTVQTINVLPIEWFAPQRDGTLMYFHPRAPNGQQVDTRYKFILIRHEPDWTNPYGEATLSGLFWPWYFKQEATRIWPKELRTSLIHGVADTDDLEKKVKFLAAIKKGMDDGFIVAQEEQIKALQLGKEGGKAFSDFMRFWKLLYQTTYLGHNMGHEITEQGARSAIEGADQVLDSYTEARLEMARPHIQQLISVLAELHGTEAPRFGWVTDVGLNMDLAERNDKLQNANPRLVFTEDYYVEAFNIDPRHIKVLDHPASQAVPTQGGNQLSRNRAPHIHRSHSLADGDDDDVHPGDATDRFIDALSRNARKIQPVTVGIRDALEGAQDIDSLATALGRLGPSEDYREQMAQVRFLADAMGYAEQAATDRKGLSRRGLFKALGSAFRLRTGTDDKWEPVPFPEAIESMRERDVILPDEYYNQLQDLARAQAFSVAGIDATSQLQAILDSLTDALSEGETFQAWRKRVIADNLAVSKLPKWRLENIYRTNVTTAMSRGRSGWQWANIQNRPWAIIRVIEDDRLEHIDLRNFVAPLASPVWAYMTPPLRYQCRCRRLTLTEAQASDYDNRSVAFQPEPGFGTDPHQDPWAGLEAAREAALVRIHPALRQLIPLAA